MLLGPSGVHIKMIFSAFNVILGFVVIGPSLADDVQQEYFKDVSLDCDLAKHNISDADVINKYWLIPDGRLVGPADSDSRINIDDNYTLNITKIDDVDFGLYSCLVVFSNFSVTAIQHGVNVNGPYFGNLAAKYRHNAIVGGIAAGSLFVFLVGGCMIFNFRYHKRSQKNKAVDALDRAIDGYDLKAYDNVGLDSDTAVTKYSGVTEENVQM